MAGAAALLAGGAWSLEERPPPPLGSPGPAPADARLAPGHQRAQGLRSGRMQEELAWETDGRESAWRREGGVGRGREDPRIRLGSARGEVGALRTATSVLGVCVAPSRMVTGPRTGPRGPCQCVWDSGTTPAR